ncbi:MAG: hypothetical protein GF408_05445 [Candidatus Omnitrophica bacterium]|nr:hypothetical protein [Candidatus Omnitrophota bacterium]
MNKLFASMSIGCDEISLVAARWNRKADYIKEAFSRSEAEGLSRGIVTDAEKAVRSIQRAVKKLRDKAGKEIHEIYSSVTSEDLEIIPSGGMVLLSRYGREVTARDVRRCVGIARAARLPLEKEVLHYYVKGFSIDGNKEIKNPIGLEGIKLEAKLNIAVVRSSVLRNLSKCISLAGYFPAGYVFSATASSKRVLSPDEIEEGVTLLDICGDLSEATYFKNGIPEGHKNITVSGKDLVLRDGSLCGRSVKDLAGSLRDLAEAAGGNTPKVVVTGEGAMAEGLIEEIENDYEGSVVSGTCFAGPYEDLPPERAAYIEALGVIDHLREERKKDHLWGGYLRQAFNSALIFLDKYF